MERDHREHVVFDVVVHVPVDEAQNWIHVDSAGIQTMIEHVLGKTRVLPQSLEAMYTRLAAVALSLKR